MGSTPREQVASTDTELVDYTKQNKMKMLGGSIWFYTFLPEVQVTINGKYLTSYVLLYGNC